MIVVGSAFRNAGRGTEREDGLTQAARAVKRVAALQRFFASDHVIEPHDVRMVAAEGDSTDDTIDALRAAAEAEHVNLTIVDVTHGGPVFGSTEAPERMRLLSGVGNGIFQAVQLSDDYLLYVESDLIWTPAVAYELMKAVECGNGPGVDDTTRRIVAPLVMAGPHFYDIWGFRGLDGERWGPFAPYHVERNPVALTEVSSAGSCLFMPAAAADSPPMTDGALVQWCKGARAAGWHIYVHPMLTVRHPA